ncbi:MAG: metal ABC transporter substrate-binding protein [Mariprofundaceae bacterium]|nr:metal ABC transporter substrate-binding protein [Mariprofundaceae bacterium]
MMTNILRQSIVKFCYSFALLTCALLPIHSLQAAEIITTLPPLSSLVHWLDPKASVQCLLSASADPHHFQLTPKQVESIQKATLLIRSSRDDGQWARLQTSGITWDIWASQSSMSHEPDKHHEHHHEQGNHAWLSPHDVALILPQLADHLIHVYPNHSQAIRQRLQAADIQVKQIEKQWQDVTLSLQLHEKGTIMQHPAWLTLFQDLNIPVWTVLESDKHGQEHGPHVLENALQVIQAHPHSLLIADKRHSQQALSWLQHHHTESHMVILDALGKSDETWPELMQRNLKILQAL